MNRKTFHAETDMYRPIQQHFIRQGYEVFGEVKHCDVTARKGEELVIVEMKRSLTVDLLVQAALRQRMTDQVYIAIPKPAINLFSRKWKNICHLIKRLELGLILVTLHDGKSTLDIKMHPVPFDREKSMRQSKKKRTALLAEMEGRHGDYNVGGSSQTKLMTAYRERSIHIACCLEQFGPLTPKALRQMGTGEKTLAILTKNYYGWFEKIRRGTYGLDEKGRRELLEHPQLVAYYRKVISLDVHRNT